MSQNAAARFVEDHGGLDAWSGECLAVGLILLAQYLCSEVLWVSLDPDLNSIGWHYHVVPLIDGRTHCAWHEHLVTDVEDYLAEVFPQEGAVQSVQRLASVEEVMQAMRAWDLQFAA